MKPLLVLSAALMLLSTEVSARGGDDGPPLAAFRSRDWNAEARYFKDHADGPQFTCTLTTRDIRVVQTRPAESHQMLVQWFFFPHLNVGPPKLRWVRVGGREYEVERLPWRLAVPNSEGYILGYESPLLAVRASPGSQWLPFEYLTLDMMDLNAFTLGYEIAEDVPSPREERRMVSLRGFKAATKWCGRQLLHDRLSEQRVRELTR